MAFIVYTVFSHRLDAIINKLKICVLALLVLSEKGGNDYELTKLSYENKA